MHGPAQAGHASADCLGFFGLPDDPRPIRLVGHPDPELGLYKPVLQCCSATIEMGTPSSRMSQAPSILFPNDECFQESVA